MIVSDSTCLLTEIPVPICNLNRFRCSSGELAFSNLGFRMRPNFFLEHKLSLELRKMEVIRRMGAGCLKNQQGKGMNVEVDSGGEDFFDAAAAESSYVPEHLVIMVNGIIGSAADWRYAAEQFVKKLPDKVIVHRSECNSSRLTFDGVDMMGERLAEEVSSVVRRWPEVRKISFVAHSLGGLVARYAIGRLHGYSSTLEAVGTNENCLNGAQTIWSKPCLEQPQEARIAGLEPMNFITFATPHLGSRGHKQLPFLCGLPFLERRAPQTAHLVAGRSGKHLFLTDNDNGKPPLLLQMVDDSEDLKFMSALCAFKRRVAYANANYDHMVGWRTSSIRRQHELPKSNLLISNEKYPHIVYVERERADDIHNRAASNVGEQEIDLEDEMVRGLTQVPWERVDVSFHKSKQRYIAHSTIQVKTYWLNSDGADVVFHMIDNFLL
ncbi:alpha/beta-Hydrolases superfamily protein [Quillaja saponaria]|uniref:Alpha/beta-Hydrolases superfamily protein n=1 Tax=Quillaja saponaria TaxID=32244 RepID=A0AAD7QDG1_QUISA|nr:alpha/beta-Hydrolases superfamily protein [Quillaja saponaria]